MSDQKSHRPSKEIEAEYQNLTFRSGGLQYEIACKSKDLEMINDQLRQLAFEYIDSKKLEDAAAKVADEAKSESVLDSVEDVKE